MILHTGAFEQEKAALIDFRDACGFRSYVGAPRLQPQALSNGADRFYAAKRNKSTAGGAGGAAAQLELALGFSGDGSTAAAMGWAGGNSEMYQQALQNAHNEDDHALDEEAGQSRSSHVYTKNNHGWSDLEAYRSGKRLYNAVSRTRVKNPGIG
jgi:hypothetical protein